MLSTLCYYTTLSYFNYIVLTLVIDTGYEWESVNKIAFCTTNYFSFKFV